MGGQQTILTQEEFDRAALACEHALVALESGERLETHALGGLDGILAVLAAQPFPANNEAAASRVATIQMLLARRMQIP